MTQPTGNTGHPGQRLTLIPSVYTQHISYVLFPKICGMTWGEIYSNYKHFAHGDYFKADF